MGIGVCIVGCGLIGKKRAASLASAGARLVSCADPLPSARAAVMAYGDARAPGSAGVVGHEDWRCAVSHPGVDVVVVATPNDALSEIVGFSASSGKDVLVEKPAGRTSGEITAAAAAAAAAGTLVRVGFNHRYHPAVLKAKQIADSGGVGDLMFVRARYGHGGRVGYDREWRADPSRGGGELVDQGVHLIDLSRWFLGGFDSVEGYAGTFYWDMPVDDNAFMLLRTPAGRTAFLHASCTEWKNLFSMEIYGRTGKLHIDGIGGSYGLETLAYYRMLPEMGPPETVKWEYPMPDRSWDLELAEFMEDIRLRRKPSASLDDALAALRVVEEIHRRSSNQMGKGGDRR